MMAMAYHKTFNNPIANNSAISSTINIYPTHISSSFALTSYLPAAAGHPALQTLTPVGCAVVLLIFFAGICTATVVVRNAWYARSIRKWEGKFDDARLEESRADRNEREADETEGDEAVDTSHQGRKAGKQPAI